MDNRFIHLLGRREEEAVEFLNSQNYVYQIKHTVNPRDHMDNKINRVIRVKQRNDIIEVVVGLFEAPVTPH
ncbi:hypothetical protein BR63_05075 [Thermanaerosceptrum fracticalcis]|uniref:Uncharacterized protein n=1 Tax=Thermanaerosceptrum fracticalcis TaxID=1712410 RepID=A0A7G6E0Y3_THEFR|nr:hypothetical protein [Thermanaerosceptrum fracticalcis]QNB45737.1 hypothetical protein BR63_05075 [Thermanaerosceptrum fracticalcis]